MINKTLTLSMGLLLMRIERCEFTVNNAFQEHIAMLITVPNAAWVKHITRFWKLYAQLNEHFVNFETISELEVMKHIQPLLRDLYGPSKITQSYRLSVMSDTVIIEGKLDSHEASITDYSRYPTRRETIELT